MKEQHFTGDVGQVAAGNAVSHTHGPSQRNVINIHNGASATPSAPITELQRRAIAAKVFEVSNASDLDTIDIYRIILAEFGAEKIRELPKSEYRAAMELLAQLEKEAGAVPSPAQVDAPSPSSPPSAIPVAVEAPHEPQDYSCPHCAKHKGNLDAEIERARKARRLSNIVISLLAIFSVGSAAMAYSGALSAKGPTSAPVCKFDNGVYSVGSIVAVGGNKSRECVLGTDGTQARWEAVSPATARR